MEAETKRNIRLGIFVITGTALLITALYFIGSKQNLFGATYRLNARFYNVSGLTPGNNVRFAGIDVGTVESMEIVNDSTVNVTMLLDNTVQRFIRKNALASVGTDGLMGNRLVNINTMPQPAAPAEEGDELRTLRPVEMDEMISTLNVTNNHVADITANLSSITRRINGKNTFWTLLMDTVVAESIQLAVHNIKDMSESGKYTVQNFGRFSERLIDPGSLASRLLSDTSLPRNITNAVKLFKHTCDTLSGLSSDLSIVARNLKQGRGSLGKAINDTVLIYRINTGLINIDSGAVNFNKNMLALQKTWPFKKYFKKRKSK